MLGAIIGDVIGSTREFYEYQNKPKIGKDFELIEKDSHFTDDTVLTVALMDWAMHAETKDAASATKYLRAWGRRYPLAGFGGRFYDWLFSSKPEPYNSFGNGAGMRVSPIAYIAKTKEEVIELSDIVTGVTHNHPEGIKGARSIALAIFMALHGATKDEIGDMALSYYPEIANFSYDDLVKNYHFNERSEDTCPEALYCFLISTSFEDSIRVSASIGGDMDTLLAMSVAIAEAFYKDVPEKLYKDVWDRLDEPMKKVIKEFNDKYDKKVKKYDLNRFINAQKDDYEIAKKEIMNAKKESHRMWYIFPQIKGLGHSLSSKYYAISGIEEARDYYNHEILGARLIETSKILVNLKENSAISIFGKTDAMKLRSSMTLFYKATGDVIFKDVLDKFFKGELDPETLKII